MGEELDHEADRMVVLSDVHLDRREVMDGLNTLFTGGWVGGLGAMCGCDQEQQRQLPVLSVLSH